MTNNALMIGCSMDLVKSDTTMVLTGNFTPLLPPYPRLECFDVIEGKFITAFDTRNPEMLLLKPVNKEKILDWIPARFQNQNFYMVLDRFTTSKGNKRRVITRRWAETLKRVKFPKKGQRGCLVGVIGLPPTEVLTVVRWDPDRMRLDASDGRGTYYNVDHSKWVALPEQLINVS